ncbi:hypothetical protein [Alkaliphilus peptidifermentans]|nr:hypothetical protein [Alkaliphilus peptidifermentans]
MKKRIVVILLITLCVISVILNSPSSFAAGADIPRIYSDNDNVGEY